MDLIDITAPRVGLVKLRAGKFLDIFYVCLLLFDRSCFLNSGKEGSGSFFKEGGGGGERGEIKIRTLCLHFSPAMD